MITNYSAQPTQADQLTARTRDPVDNLPEDVPTCVKLDEDIPNALRKHAPSSRVGGQRSDLR